MFSLDRIAAERAVDGGNDGRKRPYEKLTAEERARFLEVLRETGNRKCAAAAIGVEARLMDQRREHDPELDREWEQAVNEAHRRLSAANGPFDVAPFGPFNMIRRGKKGRLQLVAAGEGRWNGAVEERFKAVLRETGNFAAAARAVGFSESAVWDRRRKWPAFAEELDRLLEEAELKLEFRIATMGNDVGKGTVTSDCPIPPLPFDMDQAMRFLKWRDEKRRGGKGRAPIAKPPSIEEVTKKIVRQVEAIKQHRRREAGQGHPE